MTDKPDGPGPKYRCRWCQTVIQSMYRHDFRYCECRRIAIDGGNAYTRLLGNAYLMEEITKLSEEMGLYDDAKKGSHEGNI